MKSRHCLEPKSNYPIRTWCFPVRELSSHRANRINIKVQSGAVSITDSVVFNANLFKEVLSANKECSKAVLQISDKGLAHIEFNVDDFNVKYWLVSQQAS